MESFTNTLKSTGLDILSKLTPVLRESKFLETGVLTPEEFVAAGDHLVDKCGTWQWAKAVDASHTVDYLPKEKQFLLTKNVPCPRRCRDVDYDASHEAIVGGDEDGDGGWVDTHHNVDFSAMIGDMGTASNVTSSSVAVDADDDNDPPPMDMDNFDFDSVQDEDPNEAVPTNTGGGESNTVGMRTYDLNITYDHYYKVPRLWLTGYTETGKPLTVNEMLEDFSAEHANKVITIESHPHINAPRTATVHPCRHAQVMKRLMEQLAERDQELNVLQYLLIFLKFMQAIIPTIEYDFTRSVAV